MRSSKRQTHDRSVSPAFASSSTDDTRTLSKSSASSPPGLTALLNDAAQRPRTHKDPGTHNGHAAPRRTPVERQRSDRKGHSHGLSWSSTTRDSVVDNLLSSLDRLDDSAIIPSTIHVAGPAAIPPSLPLSRMNTRARGHNYSYSVSSDNDYTSQDEPAASKHSAHSSSRKRSGSSSNHPHSPSLNTTTRAGTYRTSVRSSSEAHRTTSASMHVRGGSGQGGSKSSMTSTWEKAHGYNAGERHAEQYNSHTSDVTQNDNRSQSAQDIHIDSILAWGRPIMAQYTAVIEGPGSRSPRTHATRSASDSYLLSSPTSSTSPSLGSRKKDKAELDPLATKNGGPVNAFTHPDMPLVHPDIPKNVREQATDFVRGTTSRNAQNPIPQDNRVSGVSTKISAATVDPPREKQGFFKRVFGSSSNRSSSVQENQSPASKQFATPRPSDLSSAAPVKTSHYGTPVNTQPKPEPRYARGETPPPGQPMLHKKPSAFFRRRKKSVSDAMSPPSLPAQFIASPPKQPLDSPSASSLWQAMDPYIRQGGVPLPSPADQIPQHPLRDDTSPSGGEDTDDPDMFHSGYTPPPDASLRRLTPLEHKPQERRASATSPGLGSPRDGSAFVPPTERKPSTDELPLRASNKPRSPNQTPKMRIRKHRPEALHPSSFLADNSDTDDKPRSPSMISVVAYGPGDPSQPRHSPVSPVSAISPPSLDRTPRPSPRSPSAGFSQAEERIRPSLSVRTSRQDLIVDGLSRDHDEMGLGIDGVKHDAEAGTTGRIWLAPSPGASEDEDNDSQTLNLPMENMRISPKEPLTATTYHTATDLPIVQLEGNEIRPSMDVGRYSESDSGAIDLDLPTLQDKERAQGIFDGKEDFVSKSQAAPWLGENNIASIRTRKAYMDLFEWHGQNIVSAMRSLCERLVLRGETQQVDRLLEAFSARWCECNSNHGFQARDVVHTISYSLLLLNTDLHLADIESRMTRSQFVKNTLPTIKRVALDASGNDQTIRASSQQKNHRPELPWPQRQGSAPSSPGMPPADYNEDRQSLEAKRPNFAKRLSMRPNMLRSDSDNLLADGTTSNAGSNALVNQRFDGNMKAWELEVDNILKSFFTAIRAGPLPLHKAPIAGATLADGTSNAMLPPPPPSTLRRTGSILSKAPSETMSSRGRRPDFHSMASRWSSKNRSRQRFYAASTVGSSRTSFDDGNSFWSPAASSSWTKNSWSRTQTTMSTDSLGSHAMPSGYQQSIGFANALSQAIIREESAAVGDDDIVRLANLLDDESLSLEGAPWAKEGMLKHRNHLDAQGKKIKERQWGECFAVIEHGCLRLFSFNAKGGKTGSLGMRARMTRGRTAPAAPGAVVGGGNWMSNAEPLGTFLLRQTIATTLPSPGYSKTRPFVWALSLPTGAVHLFDVGTAEIAEEFMSTANYWSARLSKEPLSGGVSNVEYGWSDSVLNPALIGHTYSNTSSDQSSSAAGVPLPSSLPPSRQGHHHTASNSMSFSMSRPSVASSIRGSMDQGGGAGNSSSNNNNRARLPGDKVQIVDWTHPEPSLMASQLMEVDQLRALKDYVSGVEEDFRRHSDLRPAMILAFSPRHPNYNKALANWEKKSSYLLRENVKFKTYVETLLAARVAREKVDQRRGEIAAAVAATAAATKSTSAQAPSSGPPTAMVDAAEAAAAVVDRRPGSGEYSLAAPGEVEDGSSLESSGTERRAVGHGGDEGRSYEMDAGGDGVERRKMSFVIEA